MIELELHGAKGGGGKPHTPVETPNNLISVAKGKVLIAVAEGELAGRPTDRDIYLDGTPIANADGSLNFNGVKWEWRSGSVDQDYIQGLPEVSTEFNINYEIRDNQPWVREITTPNLDAVRVTFNWPALLKQESNGDTVGISMDYAIDLSVNGGAFQEYQVYNVNGKTNSGYERTHEVVIPKDTNIFAIRARRVTPDSQLGTVQDTINVKSYSEVVDVKQRYPNTALLYVEFDSRMFGGTAIPKVSVRTKGRIIRVPSNYNPETRSYSGIWAGDFKQAWSDNPAWVYYDMLTQDRFGLGHKVTPDMVDKFALYEVAQYCDVMVDNGKGSLEPRHTCNVYIAQKAGAWKVLNDIANIFNGMTYWNGNQFVAIADKEENISNIPVFSRSNVVNGRFDYQAADDKSIYTSALVSYDDPDNHFDTEVEAVFEREQILRWGADRQVELSAIGCTSRGQAQRKGKYTLLTNLYNRTVKFQTGLQGLNEQVMPGKIIGVTDPLISGRQFTGRILSQTSRVITLDRTPEGKAGDILYLTKPNGLTEGRTIESVSGSVVSVTTEYSVKIEPGSVWYLEAQDLKSQLYRVTKITSPSESVYEIEGVEYNESKYAAIDNGARLEPRPISVVPSNAQRAPSEVRILTTNYVEQTLAVTKMTITWDQTPNAVFYDVQWKKDDGDWVNAGTTGANEIDIAGVYTGNYVARVRAVNAIGIRSVWKNSEGTRIVGKTGAPPTLANIVTTGMLFGIRLDWSFKEGSSDTLYTQFRYGETSSFNQSIPLGDFAYPTDSHELHGLKANQRFFFWARLQDRTGNYGDWFPANTAAGIEGSSLTNDNGQYNDYFAGLISATALDKQLYDRVELIDGPDTLPGSVNNRLKPVVERVETVDARVDEANARIDQINNDIGEIAGISERLDGIDTSITNANNKIDQINTDLGNRIDGTNTKIDEAVTNLEGQIANFKDALVYDPAKTYVANDIVRVNNKLYQALRAVPLNTTPPNATYWKDVGTSLVEANALALQVSTNTTNIGILDGKTTAIASSLDVLQAAYREDDGVGDMDDAINDWNNSAQIAEEKLVRANEDESLAQRIVTIQAQFNEADAKITTFEQAIATEKEARTEANRVISASLIDTNAQIVQSNTAIANLDKATAESIESIRGQVGDNKAAVDNLTSIIVDRDSATATQFESLKSQVDSNTAGISTLSETVATNNSAITQRVDTLTSEVGDNTSKITSLTETQANQNSATNQRIDSLSTEVGNNTTNITNLTKTVTDNNTAIGTRLETIETNVEGNKTSITNLSEAVSTTNSANATRFQSIETNVGNNTSSITDLARTVTDNNTSTTTLLQGLRTDVNGNKSSIETLSETQSTQNTATNSRIDSLTTEVGTNKSNISNLTQTVTDNASTTATAIQTVNSRVDKEITDREGAVNAEKAAREAAVSTEATTRADADGALGRRIDTTEANIANNEAFIQRVEEAQVTLENVVAGITTTVEAVYSLNRDDDGVGEQDDAISDWKNLAYYSEEVKTRANEDEALAQRITTLGVEFNAEAARLDGVIQEERTVRATEDGVLATRIDLTIAKAQTEFQRVDASLLSEATARASADEAISERVEQTNASIATETSKREAAIRSEESARVSGDEAVANRVDQLTTTVDTEVGRLNSAITTEETARINGDTAISSRVDTIEAGLITDTQVNALIQTETNARISADNALGERIDTVQAKAGENTVAIQQNATATATLDGKVSGAYTLKMEAYAGNQYVAAGIALGVGQENGLLQSQFLVRADRFAVVNGTTATTTAPFVIQNGQVFINDVLINKATITNALIGSTLSSQDVAAWAGLPATVMTFAGSGALVFRNPNRANSYSVHQPDSSYWVVDGVLRVRIGSWT